MQVGPGGKPGAFRAATVLARRRVAHAGAAARAPGAERRRRGGDDAGDRRRPGRAVVVEDLFADITRGNVTEVKVVLASVVMALACYQLVLIAVGYGKVRPTFLGPRPASLAHRAAGDAIVVMVVVVALMCLSYFGFGEDRSLHVIAATALLVVLALKIAVVRWWHGLGRLLPFLGVSVFGLLAVTWLTSAGDFLADR